MLQQQKDLLYLSFTHPPLSHHNYRAWCKGSQILWTWLSFTSFFDLVTFSIKEKCSGKDSILLFSRSPGSLRSDAILTMQFPVCPLLFNQAIDAFVVLFMQTLPFFTVLYVLNAAPDVFWHNQKPWMLLDLLLKAVQTYKSCVAPSLSSLSCEAKVSPVMGLSMDQRCF